MKNFLRICLVVPLTVIGVLHLHLCPLCYGLSQDTSSQQEDAERGSGPCVPTVMEKGPGDGAQKCSWVMYTQDRGFLHAVHVYSPLHPALNNAQFSSVGADVFIPCCLIPR